MEDKKAQQTVLNKSNKEHEITNKYRRGVDIFLKRDTELEGREEIQHMTILSNAEQILKDNLERECDIKREKTSESRIRTDGAF